MRNAFSYSRVSSESQVDNASLPTQREAIQKYADEHGITILREFVEEGVTGTTLDRPALTELRDKIGQVDTVIMLDPDRMGRKLINQIIVYEELEKAGVSIEFVKGGIVGNTPEEKMLFNMRGMFAEYELSKIRERTLRGRRQRAKNGLFVGGASGKLYGYDYIKGKREVNPETSKRVKLIYQLYLEGETISGVTARLHALGIPSPTGQPTWRRDTVFRILSNPAYTGKAEFMDITIDQPELVSVEDFEKVRARFARNRAISGRNSKGTYLLTGYLFCSECGRRYMGSASAGVRYYVCPNGSRKKRLNPCKGKPIKADTLEEMVWYQIGQTLSNPEMAKFGLDSVSGEDYEPELINLRARREHYKHERRSRLK